MSLTETQLKLIEEGLALAVAAVLAAVRMAGETPDAPLDWSKLRITETPEMALEIAKQKLEVRRRNKLQESGDSSQESE